MIEGQDPLPTGPLLLDTGEKTVLLEEHLGTGGTTPGVLTSDEKTQESFDGNT